MTDEIKRACKIIEALLEGYGTEQMTMDEWRDGEGRARAFLVEHGHQPKQPVVDEAEARAFLQSALKAAKAQSAALSEYRAALDK
jgi:hypothetical protein